MSKLATAAISRVAVSRSVWGPPTVRTVRLAPGSQAVATTAFRRYASTSEPSSGARESAGAGSAREDDNSGRFDAGPKPKDGKPALRISWIFGGLAGLGALVTIYGLLEFYSTLTTWPKTIRKPLRAALKSKLNGDYMRSEKYFREAIDVTMALGPEGLETDPLLKITGIYVELANVLELMGQRVTAFQELRTALEMYGVDPIRRPGSTGAGEWAGGAGYQLTERDHLRVIGLHQKLGQLALEASSSAKAPPFTRSAVELSPGPGFEGNKVETWNDAAEYYLSSALTAMLQLGLAGRSPSTGQSGIVLGRDIALPEAPGEEDTEGGRVDKRGLGMTMESLSEVYARKKQYDLAAQLLLQAVSLLLPPQTEITPPVRDRCQAAMLMTTISSHALKARSADGKSPESQSKAIKVARSWSLRSLQISEQAINDGDPQGASGTPAETAMAVCQRARAVGLHNMGMLAEMEGDLPSALNMFNKALTAARETNFKEGKREAQAAIRRVQALGGASKP
ncbi:hypothetical protein IAU60_000965 [Kwoniella sp. DSM 27419]